MITFEEIKQLLPNYSEERIKKAILEISKFDSTVIPNSQEYDENMVERLEDVLYSIEESISESKEIGEAKQYALKLIQEKGIYCQQKLLDELFYLCVEENIARAKAFHEVGVAAFSSTLAHLQGEELKQATEQHIKKLYAFNMLLNDCNKLDAILEEYGIGAIPASVETVSTEAVELFDAEEFRRELLGGAEPKKPTTRQGSKQLLKLLMSG